MKLPEERSTSSRLLDSLPLGGEVYRLMDATKFPSRQPSTDVVDSAALEGRPIGGKVYELASPPEPALSRLVFAFSPDPIGGEQHRLKNGPASELGPHAMNDDETTAITDPNLSRQLSNTVAHNPLSRPEKRGSPSNASARESGVAVRYRLPGRTANGEVANPNALTAGHRTLPFGSRIRVVNRSNGASVVVRINDRGPQQRKFIIDLSVASAKALRIRGTAPVTLYPVPSQLAQDGLPDAKTIEGRSARVGPRRNAGGDVKRGEETLLYPQAAE